MEKIQMDGNANIGLMGFATNEFLLIGKGVRTDEEKIRKEMGAEIFRIKIAGTDFAGLFITGNAKKIYVPKIIFEEELDELKANFNVEILNTKYTALGNNVIFGKKILTNREMEESAVKDLKAKPFSFGDNPLIGANVKLNSENGIVTPDASDEEIDYLEKELKIKAGVGTVNFGTKQVGSGLLVNDKGILVGNNTSGPEFMRLKEIFDL